MNKFEKKAMAKRAYKALVKCGFDLYYDRISPDMMRADEFEYNGARAAGNNPKFGLGAQPAYWNNVDIPKGDKHWANAPRSSRAKRPSGPLMSLEAARALEPRQYAPDPITGLDPLQKYLLTGGRSYVPDSINLDDTPY